MKILRVLLVDDDPKFLDFAGGTLTSAKYSVSSVSDFEAAAAALDDFRGKAVVLSDLNVKRQSALVFLRESHKKYGHVPFTILAQSPSLESVIEALKQGAYDFLRKPVSPDRLLERSRAEVERVKNISSFKGFLISTTAHDFNSTLTVLDGYNHFLKERCKECREPGATNLREQTQRSITRLRAMTATLMDYEAAERGELRLTSKKFDLTALLKDCVTFYKPYAEQKQVDMGLEEQLPSLTVHGDPARVMQVMDNLLYNAVKFTPSKGEIRVGAKPEGEGVATVWVRDTGVGIPKKIQDKIFGESVSVSDEDGSSRMGLGLSICRKLIEAQNGKIWLESTQGKGTVVSFSLPRQ
jgi:signal transduction histidine kinase